MSFFYPVLLAWNDSLMLTIIAGAIGGALVGMLFFGLDREELQKLFLYYAAIVILVVLAVAQLIPDDRQETRSLIQGMLTVGSYSMLATAWWVTMALTDKRFVRTLVITPILVVFGVIVCQIAKLLFPSKLFN